MVDRWECPVGHVVPSTELEGYGYPPSCPLCQKAHPGAGCEPFRMHPAPAGKEKR